MTARDELLALARRCEEASGSDWELDRDISKAVEPPTAPTTVMEYRESPFRDCTFQWRCRHEGQDWGGWWHGEAYTASLDTALSLVPTNHFWQVFADYDCHCGALVESPVASIEHRCNAATAALSLAGAALRARAATLATKETDHGWADLVTAIDGIRAQQIAAEAALRHLVGDMDRSKLGRSWLSIKNARAVLARGDEGTEVSRG